jgi:hypothetical protein
MRIAPHEAFNNLKTTVFFQIGFVLADQIRLDSRIIESRDPREAVHAITRAIFVLRRAGFSSD